MPDSTIKDSLFFTNLIDNTYEINNDTLNPESTNIEITRADVVAHMSTRSKSSLYLDYTNSNKYWFTVRGKSEQERQELKERVRLLKRDGIITEYMYAHEEKEKEK